MFKTVFQLGTDRISGKVRFRPDIRLHFPVPVPVRQRKILPDFCRKMFAFLRTCFHKKYDFFSASSKPNTADFCAIR